jgi:hypothetical protein
MQSKKPLLTKVFLERYKNMLKKKITKIYVGSVYFAFRRFTTNHRWKMIHIITQQQKEYAIKETFIDQSFTRKI